MEEKADKTMSLRLTESQESWLSKMAGIKGDSKNGVIRDLIEDARRETFDLDLAQEDIENVNFLARQWNCTFEQALVEVVRRCMHADQAASKKKTKKKKRKKKPA